MVAEHEARPDVTIGAGCSHTLRVEIPRRQPGAGGLGPGTLHV